MSDVLRVRIFIFIGRQCFGCRKAGANLFTDARININGPSLSVASKEIIPSHKIKERAGHRTSDVYVEHLCRISVSIQPHPIRNTTTDIAVVTTFLSGFA